MNIRRAEELLLKADTSNYIGKVSKVIGMIIEATGKYAKIGQLCEIKSPHNEHSILAEVVGFRDGKVLLMAYKNTQGIGPGSFVHFKNGLFKLKISDSLKGRVIDAMGNPIDSLGDIKGKEYSVIEDVHTNPLLRPLIEEKVSFGVKAIDGLLTIGKGQRMGIFAGSGVGKSTLLGMIAKNVVADVNVIALVGERGREVQEFIQILGEEGLKKTVLVVATSDQSPMQRSKCVLTATTIAEYFKDQGKDVLLMMDSLTRYAMAKREIGLARGEPPIAKGYTPSIYADLPKLLERSGNFENGSITGIYTVLVEGDDTNEPISDTVRGIVDGHIVLSRQLANSNHFPAIDVNQSISRIMKSLVEKEHDELASKLRVILSNYEENKDLVLIGAYKQGTNPKLDYTLSKIDLINDFLKQDTEASFSEDETLSMMKQILG